MRRSNSKSDENCTVGTGALIVFVSMVLLASLITFTLVKITEEIAQSSQKTSEDVRRDVVNSIIITGAWVYDNYDDMLFMVEFGAAGEPLQRVDVQYVLTCTEPDGTFNYRSAVLGDSGPLGSDIFVWELGDEKPANVAGNVDNFRPGARYFFTLDGGTNDAPNGAECGPVHLDENGIQANLYLHIPNGQSSHQVLSLSNGREIGSQII